MTVLLGLIECEGRRTLRGHCLFTGLYVLLGRRCPLQPRLYRQKKVCEQEGLPFQSKIDLAVAEIEQFEPVAGMHTHVLIDSRFHCRRVRRAAQKRGWDVSGALKSNRKLRQIDADGNRTWLALADYAAQLKPTDWQEAVWPSQEGDRPVYVHAVKTWIRKLGPTLLLITCHDRDNPGKSIRYWGSTRLEAEPQTVLNHLAVRWHVEVLFEDNKDLLGADHYQLMNAEAILSRKRMFSTIWGPASVKCLFRSICSAALRPRVSNLSRLIMIPKVRRYWLLG